VEEIEPVDEAFVRLDIRELRAMAALDPSRLLRWLHDSERLFILGVERFEESEDRWGGRYRLTLNRNIELHFIEDFNTAMLDVSELPQFCVMPHSLKLDTVERRELPGLPEDDAGEKSYGLIFYLSPEDFEDILEELEELVREWSNDPFNPKGSASFPFLPECYFRELDLIDFIKRQVLSNPDIAALEIYNGRLGYPLTPPESDPIEEDMPYPLISEEDDWMEEGMQADWGLGTDAPIDLGGHDDEPEPAITAEAAAESERALLSWQQATLGDGDDEADDVDDVDEDEAAMSGGAKAKGVSGDISDEDDDEAEERAREARRRAEGY
jgi:hypothetical protein